MTFPVQTNKNFLLAYLLLIIVFFYLDIILGGAEKYVWLNNRLDQKRLVQIELKQFEWISNDLKRLDFDSSRSFIYDPASNHESNSWVRLNYCE